MTIKLKPDLLNIPPTMLDQYQSFIKSKHFLETEMPKLKPLLADVKKKPNSNQIVLMTGRSDAIKTYISNWLGNSLNREIHRIDLSKVVSKYIGETEKNLSVLFEKAESKNWILFFDEADALFGKRTQVSDSHDKYANQEVSYLLQKMKKYRGIIILSANSKAGLRQIFITIVDWFLLFRKLI
jgi:SpoVK/Ycf46/Vps4 family AAA+-type ATPase